MILYKEGRKDNKYPDSERRNYEKNKIDSADIDRYFCCLNTWMREPAAQEGNAPLATARMRMNPAKDTN